LEIFKNRDRDEILGAGYNILKEGDNGADREAIKKGA